MTCFWTTKAVNCDSELLNVCLISSTSELLLRKILLNLVPKVLNLVPNNWVLASVGLSN